MATSLISFVEGVRVLLNDNDPAGIYDISTDEILASMRLALNLGKIPNYFLSGSDVSPDLIPATDPYSFSLFSYHAAWPFIRAMMRESFNTRAFSSSQGEQKELIDYHLNAIYILEQGDMCSQ